MLWKILLRRKLSGLSLAAEVLSSPSFQSIAIRTQALSLSKYSTYSLGAKRESFIIITAKKMTAFSDFAIFK